MKKCVKTDIAIIGGGIAGLWLLNRLRKLGFTVVLLESATLGGGQTHKSQGIIHGGMKYTLQGATTAASQAIANMPLIWQQCLQGKGEIDLSQVPILSQHQYLWSPNVLAAKLAGFFAGIALKGKVHALNKAEFPAVFKSPQFKGQLYSLDEMTIDVQILIRELVKSNQDAIFKIDPLQEKQLHMDPNNRLLSLEIQTAPLPPLEIKAQKYIFAAGSGNEIVLKKMGDESVAMQRRPLHMVLMKTDYAYPLYAHCLGLSATPRITVTTHLSHDGKTIWYLGGQIAEEGVKRDAQQQIEVAKKELQELFPWLDFSAAQFASFFVDRAEGAQPDGKRPDSCYVKEIENMLIVWPTKLAFAPLLADEIIQQLTQEKITPQTVDLHELRDWPIPNVAKPIWDQLL